MGYGKYSPLYNHFKKSTNDIEELSFKDIENIIKCQLPNYAKEGNIATFWNNGDSRNHVKSWLDAGWKVKNINSEKKIVFKKNSKTMLPKPQKTRKDKIDKPEIYLDRLLDVFKNIEYQRQCIEKCEEKFRSDDADRIFYKYIISYPDDKFTSDYIKHVYAMLILWNMNKRGAELSEIKVFTETILENSQKIKQLSRDKLSEINDKSFEIFEDLFNNLTLVKTKSPLVTFSKTLHFFLPNLVVPIDGKYTCNFFKINPYQENGKKEKLQFDIFINLHKAFCEFAQKYSLSDLVDKTSDRNLNIPKVIDNMLIGHSKIINKKIK